MRFVRLLRVTVPFLMMVAVLASGAYYMQTASRNAAYSAALPVAQHQCVGSSFSFFSEASPLAGIWPSPDCVRKALVARGSPSAAVNLALLRRALTRLTVAEAIVAALLWLGFWQIERVYSE